MNLVKPDGFVGLLTPSGIYADKTAAQFFKTVSTSGRVEGRAFRLRERVVVEDGEGVAPPRASPSSRDIHGRSFKFCALIFGGRVEAKRTFDETKCAFFLHDAATMLQQARPLLPAW